MFRCLSVQLAVFEMVALGKDVSRIENRRSHRRSLGKRPKEPLVGQGRGISPLWRAAGGDC